MTNDSTFVDYITASTDKLEHIQYRAEVWRRRLQAIVDTTSVESRTFSHDLKVQLYKDNPTCQICGQRIHDIDDTEVDHIVHYWRGGKTIPENARLTHRYCNRARGNRD